MVSTLILQTESSSEIRAILGAGLTAEVPPTIVRCGREGLATYREGLRGGTALPVGSVEFLREAFEVAGVPEPANMSYPFELLPFLQRKVLQGTAHQVLTSPCAIFVKPLETKVFTGFVFDPSVPADAMDAHEAQQLQVLRALPGETPVWTCQPVAFLCEWRYYLQAGKLLGQARYDAEGLDDAPSPNMPVVLAAARQLQHQGPCALDFAVLEDGSTVLVEANDFWALGLYGRALSGAQYLQCLESRWWELHRGQSATS
jgi:hypothetical protein